MHAWICDVASSRCPRDQTSRKSDHCPKVIESRCGAVALGRTYLLPPLSSGGALVVRPWLRFHIPLIGRVEGWRAGVARVPDPHHVSSPLHVARNVRISRIARPHLLHAKAYGTY